MRTPRLLSVNIAADLHHNETWTGRQRRSGIDKRPVDGPRLLARDAVEGDAVINTVHHGGPWQAVYAYAREDADYWEQRLGVELPNGRFGENLTTVGLDLTAALIGERWRVGQAVLQVTLPRIPCRTFAGFWDRPDLISTFTDARRPGAYLRIVEEGRVRAGDPVEVVDRPETAASIGQAFACKTGDRTHLDLLRATPGLAPSWTQWLERIGA